MRVQVDGRFPVLRRHAQPPVTMWTTEQSAALLLEHRRALRSQDELPAGAVPSDRDSAYRVQDALIQLHLDAGDGPVAGWKVALTNPAMQEMFGVDEPAEGAIFRPLVYSSAARLDPTRYRHLGAEGEIVLQMRESLVPDQAPFTAATVSEAVGGYMAGIEIVDDRDAGADATIGLLVADNAMNYGCVIGQEVAYTPAVDLAAVSGRLTIDGQPAGEGVGENVLGGPLQVLALLGNSLARRGRSLDAGAIVMTGSLAVTVWPQPGETVRWEVDGLEAVEFTLEA